MDQSEPTAPDLVGLLWDEAEPVLQERGIPYEALLTGPPGRTEGEGPVRVVAQRAAAGSLQIILAHRSYRRAAAQHSTTQGG